MGSSIQPASCSSTPGCTANRLHMRRPNKRFRLILITGTVLLVIYIFIQSPLSPLHMCTLMGCQDSLVLSLSNEPDVDYSLRVTSSSGETRKVDCTPGEDKIHYSDSSPAPIRCQNGKVTFFDFAPDQVSIVIDWHGQSFTSHGDPSYASFRPNGYFCPPVCRVGKFQVDIP